MDDYHHRYDTSGRGRENKMHRKKGFAAGVVMGSSGSEDAERKPKFVSTLAITLLYRHHRIVMVSSYHIYIF